MKAAVLHTPGLAPVYGEHPAPEGGEGMTVVHVTAAPVVPLDLLCASGTSYFGVPRTPYVPGGQGVGTVKSSATFEPGSRVWFFATAGMKPGDGSLAELCAVPDVDVVPIAADVSDPLAAALGLSGVAAWMALTWRARLAAGERVLVLGGGGAVGQAGIGVARVLGAAEVIALARPSSVARAQAAGADVVLTLETSDVDALATVLAAHGPYDVILDPVFGIPATAAARELAVGGRLREPRRRVGGHCRVLLGLPSQQDGRRTRLHQQRAQRTTASGRGRLSARTRGSGSDPHRGRGAPPARRGVHLVASRCRHERCPLRARPLSPAEVKGVGRE